MYGIEIKANSGKSQYQQLYSQLRDKIATGSLKPETKIASTRQLSGELHISRSIVLEVLDQLKIEGFLETRKGSGTYVKPSVSYKEGFSLPPGKQPDAPPAKPGRLSFIAGIPQLEDFPRRAWNQCYTHALEYASNRDLGYTHPLGHKQLRKALQSYLFRTKGIEAELDRIVITSGASQALAIMAQLKEKQKIVLEDPIAGFVHDIFKEHKCSIELAQVDSEGIIPESISKNHKDLIYVSPSHQFPLGGTLSAQRRIELLNIAVRNKAFIIEDDYDGEYRYDHRPIAPIQTLGPHRVVYIGTFSKILSPALRLGYMIIPPALRDSVKKLKSRWDLFNEGLQQKAMAAFISEGHLERYNRKMIKLYKARKQKLEDAVNSILGPEWKILGNTTGLHLVLQKTGCNFDSDFRDALLERGISIEPVSAYSIENSAHKDKLVFGYGNNTIETLKKGLLEIKALCDNL